MSTNEEKTIQLNPIGTVQNSGESFAVEIPATVELDTEGFPSSASIFL